MCVCAIVFFLLKTCWKGKGRKDLNVFRVVIILGLGGGVESLLIAILIIRKCPTAHEISSKTFLKNFWSQIHEKKKKPINFARLIMT